MDYAAYKASAPGSMMLFGEHAVLYDRTAICAAIDKRIYVSLVPRNDDQIIVHSNAFPTATFFMSQLSVQKPYQFVLSVLETYAEQIPSGCEIYIRSEFSPTVGFGSSAAITVAMVAVIDEWLCLSLDPTLMMHRARDIVRKVQGSGSGADVAASTFGGLIAYEQHDDIPLRLPGLPILHAIYSGYKTPTVDMIALIKQHRQAHQDQVEALFDKIETSTKHAMLAIEEQDWGVVGKAMSQQFHYQRLLGMSDSTLDTIVHVLQQPQILGAKISGSGLGDCIVAIGDVPAALFPSTALPQTRQFILETSVLGVTVNE